MVKPTFFKNPEALRKWFQKNHDKKQELFIGYYKKDSGKASVTWPETVEQALCFGWIDGIRRRRDDESYVIRFTPRKPNSNWSAVNLKLVAKLKKEGLMTQAGLDIFNIRNKKKANYAYESGQGEPLSKEYEALFRKNKKAWKYFQSQRPSYRKPCTAWVMSAKQEATRLRRLNVLIESSEKQDWIPSMRWGKKK